MAIPAIAAALLKEGAKQIVKAGAKQAAKQTVKKGVVTEAQVARARKVSDDIYNARRRAKRAEARISEAISWVDSPSKKVSSTAKKYASQFTREELEKLKKSYKETAEDLTPKSRGDYHDQRAIDRLKQKAKRENEIYENLRKSKPGLTLREKSAYERLEKSPSSRDAVWSLVNKQLGKRGHLPTPEDIKAVGGSDDLEEALNNIFEQLFEMSMEEAEEYDSVNMGSNELYNKLQFVIATGKPASQQPYRETSKTGWYESKVKPEPQSSKRAKGKAKADKRKRGTGKR